MCSEVTQNRIRGGLAPLSSLTMLESMYGTRGMLAANPNPPFCYGWMSFCRRVAHNQLEGSLDPIASLRKLTFQGR